MMFINDENKRISVEKMRNFLSTNNKQVVKCEKCNGLGLKMGLYKSDISIWNGEYCDECKGLGYIDKKQSIKRNFFEKSIIFFLEKWYGRNL